MSRVSSVCLILGKYAARNKIWFLTWFYDIDSGVSKIVFFFLGGGRVSNNFGKVWVIQWQIQGARGPPHLKTLRCRTHQPRQTRPNSGGGVAEGHPIRFDKGGVAIIFYFLRVKNRTF